MEMGWLRRIYNLEGLVEGDVSLKPNCFISTCCVLVEKTVDRQYACRIKAESSSPGPIITLTKILLAKQCPAGSIRSTR